MTFDREITFQINEAIARGSGEYDFDIHKELHQMQSLDKTEWAMDDGWNGWPRKRGVQKGGVRRPARSVKQSATSHTSHTSRTSHTNRSA